MNRTLPVWSKSWIRPALGAALILHAAAHPAALLDVSSRIGEMNEAGSAGQAYTSLWIASLLAALAIPLLLTGGLGALRVRVFTPRWRTLALGGLLLSLTLLLFFQPANLTGAALSALLVLVLYQAGKRDLSREPLAVRGERSAWHVLARFGWLGLVAFLSLSTALRPVFLRWGTRPQEAYAALPGDVLPPGQGFEILHAVTIDATPEQVWPWLAQLGHDRGGFYSYAWLENLFGLHIVNADRVVAAWQTRELGETVPATPAGWLGLDRPLGWRVTSFEPGRVLVLEDWGAFALVPLDPETTRFYIRSQGRSGEAASLLWSPVEVFMFEPAHFIMQRRMMLGIKERAERLAREQRAAMTAAEHR